MASPSQIYFPPTKDDLIDGMTHGYKWVLNSDRTVDYSLSNGFKGEYWYNSAVIIDNLKAIFTIFGSYANIKFNYVGYFTDPITASKNGSEINISLDGSGLFFNSYSAYARSYFPYPTFDVSYSGQSGDVFINLLSPANNFSYSPGSEGWFLLLHEIGHSLGLKHPHDDGGTGRPNFTNLGITELDLDLATIMSYNDGASWNNFQWDPATPMLLDVLALQYLYGKNKTTNSGDTKFDLTDTNYYLTLWDASGNDTVDASGDSTGWTIRLPAISLSTLSDEKIGFALPTYEFLLSTPTTLYWLIGDIENIKGTSFNDDLTGNSLNNVIDGSAGNDKLKGAEGNDNLIGGLGLDTAIYIGKYNEYSITYSKTTGVYTVTDNQANRDGIDTLYGIEYIQFSDSTVNVNNLVFNSTYRILAQKSNYDEGSFALFSLVTTNVAAGTTINYSISGISSADLSSGNLTGTTVVGSDGTSTISIGLTTDNQTEGPETLTVTVLGNSASVTINDTSVNKGPAASDLVYVFKSEKTGPAVNPASYSYYYTSNLDEVKYINAQANWPWVQKASTFEAAHSNPSLSTPVFKFWSDKLQAPYFTISNAERDQIISWSSTGKNGYDWKYAGTGFSVYTSSAPTDALGKSAIPVYCVWMDDTDFNPANGLSGGLLFTADKVEYAGLVKLVGVTGVGAVFYGEVPGN